MIRRMRRREIRNLEASLMSRIGKTERLRRGLTRRLRSLRTEITKLCSKIAKESQLPRKISFKHTKMR